MSKPTAVRPGRRASRALLALLLGLLGVILVPASPASAHAELLRSVPADGASLPAAPPSISLVFGEEILADGLGMVATAADGTKVALGRPTVTGTRVVAAWPPDAPGGRYKVAWRVVSADGHPISGVLTFSYAGASPSSSPSPTTTSTGSAPPTTSSSSSPTDVASPSLSPASSTTDGSATAWPLLLGIGALLAAVVVVVVVVARRSGGERA